MHWRGNTENFFAITLFMVSKAVTLIFFLPLVLPSAPSPLLITPWPSHQLFPVPSRSPFLAYSASFLFHLYTFHLSTLSFPVTTSPSYCLTHTSCLIASPIYSLESLHPLSLHPFVHGCFSSLYLFLSYVLYLLTCFSLLPLSCPIHFPHFQTYRYMTHCST